MKQKLLFVIITLSIITVLITGCRDGSAEQSVEGGSQTMNSADEDSKWADCGNIYATVVQYSGENESTEKYLEIAERSQMLFSLLEENADAFVMNADNYLDIHHDGTPLYTMNEHNYPVEIAPNGQSIQVSRNYFYFNPIETVDGSDLIEQIIYDDMTLNVLVPEKYQEMEDQIIEAYRSDFYFQKVVAENDYNEMAGIDIRSDIREEDLIINIIYVKDGQQYFTYRKDCATDTDNWITDPVVQIYTSNIHCNYAHSFMSQWVYFSSDGDTAEMAFEDIRPYVEQCNAEDSFQQVRPIYN